MKKLLTFFLMVTMMSITLGGCGNSNLDEQTQPTNESVVQPNTNEDIDILRVGIDLKYYPFMYENEKGEPSGLEPQIAYAFGEFMNMPVEIVNTDFSMLIPALDTGNIDIIISDMSSNESRLEKADFSEPYRYGHTLALVNKDFAIENNITNDMSSKEFFAIEDANFVGLSGTIAVTIPLENGVEVVEVTDVANAVIDISRGNYDIIIGSDAIRGDHASNADTTVIYEGIDNYIGSRFVVKKGNDNLLEKANEFIPTLYEDGGLYEQIGTSLDTQIGEFLQDSSLGLDYIVSRP